MAIISESQAASPDRRSCWQRWPKSLRAKGFQAGRAMKICYRHPAETMVLPQNDSAAGSVGHTLTHRIPVTFNGDRLFRGRTA
jgi:hypothetical protein